MSALSQSKFLNLSVDANGIAHIVLARAPVNAVHEPMYLEIAEVFNNPDRHVPGARAIVLSGQGKHFCGGHDLDEFALMTPQTGVELMRRVREAFSIYDGSGSPVAGRKCTGVLSDEQSPLQTRRRPAHAYAHP